MATSNDATTPPHPLAPLSMTEFIRVRDIVVKSHDADTHIYYRSIYLHEPPKSELAPFLEAEHNGTLTPDTGRPARLAEAQYDVVTASGHQFTTAIVDLGAGKIVRTSLAAPGNQPFFTLDEFIKFQEACIHSTMFKQAMSEFSLPDHFDIAIDPWPYGPLPESDGLAARRCMQGLVFARDTSSGNPDSNHYAYPIPIIPVMDLAAKEIIRVDRLATGGAGEPLLVPERDPDGPPKKMFESSRPAEYVPELLPSIRNDLKPLDITQPEGPSFRVHADNLVEWQRWRFRVSFTPREGAVLHDVTYADRPIVYRLSYSELTVPYADPRPPFHRKQAFDLGDGGLGRAANNLRLGCDCVGAIHYFDSLMPMSDGQPVPATAVICLHEQDNGILWKHTNYRTDRTVVTRLRELVVQSIATLANYEYIMAFKLDVAGNITVEMRATGIVSVVGIDEGKNSAYGNVVAPGILAQNHQHIFAVRIDPAIDSYAEGSSQVVIEESVPRPIDAATNPHGNLYEVTRQPVEQARWIDAEPSLNRAIRLENADKRNEASGKPVGYRLVPSPTQLLLAAEGSVAARRAPFARHHVWVTGYRDGELWAAGEFTNQSLQENGGVGDMVKRGDWFVDRAGVGDDAAGFPEGGKRSSPVVWSVFCLTHNPRVEDWPVMPVEIHQLHLRPADFFTANPALDVPSRENKTSVAVPCCDADDAPGKWKDKATGSTTEAAAAGADVPEFPSAQENPLSHFQGSGPDVDAEAAGAGVGTGTDTNTSSGGGKRISRMMSGLLKNVRKGLGQDDNAGKG